MNSVVKESSILEKKKMHYPVMTEKHLADRWQVSLKTLRRWRLDGEGPVWHKLFRQVRYHDADVLEFEQRSAQHLMTMLGITREFKPAEPEATLGQGLGAEAESHYFTAKEIAEAASLPIYLFRDQAERNRKRVPHLMQVGKLIAHELLMSLRENVSVDWAHRDSARARMRVLVKRILRKYGYPPDLQDTAVQTVLQQAEALSSGWSVSRGGTV